MVPIERIELSSDPYQGSVLPLNYIGIFIKITCLNNIFYLVYRIYVWYNFIRDTLTVECLPPKEGDEMTKKDFLIFSLIIIIILLIILLFK